MSMPDSHPDEREFGDSDIDPEDPSPSLFDEGSDDWYEEEGDSD